MIVLSIDQSLSQSGWAVLEGDGQHPVLLDSGNVPTKRDPSDPANLARLGHIFTEILFRINAFDKINKRPDLVIIERYFSRNYQGTLAVAEVRGIIKLICSKEGLRFAETPPQSVRKEVLGNGRAEKEEVAAAVRQLVTVKDGASLDETDAIAMGIFALRKHNETITAVQEADVHNTGSATRISGPSVGDTQNDGSKRRNRRPRTEKATGKGE